MDPDPTPDRPSARLRVLLALSGLLTLAVVVGLLIGIAWLVVESNRRAKLAGDFERAAIDFRKQRTPEGDRSAESYHQSAVHFRDGARRPWSPLRQVPAESMEMARPGVEAADVAGIHRPS